MKLQTAGNPAFKVWHMHVALARARFATWAPTHVSETDSLVLEANAKAWVLYDQLEPLVGQVTVVHPAFL